jgi:hypothetical protein
VRAGGDTAHRHAPVGHRQSDRSSRGRSSHREVHPTADDPQFALATKPGSVSRPRTSPRCCSAGVCPSDTAAWRQHRAPPLDNSRSFLESRHRDASCVAIPGRSLSDGGPNAQRSAAHQVVLPAAGRLTALIQSEVVVACSHGRSSSSMLSGLKTTFVALRDRIHPLTGKHRRRYLMLN